MTLARRTLAGPDEPAGARRSGLRRLVIRAWLAAFVVYVLMLLSPYQLPLRYMRLVGKVTLHEAGHFLVFALLVGFLPFIVRRWRLLASWAALLVALAVSVEGLQRFIPHRVFTLRDVGANVLGCLSGLVLGLALRLLLSKWKRQGRGEPGGTPGAPLPQ